MPSSLQQDPKTYCIDHFGHRFDPIATEPLSTRAWILQERVLSPKTIHYANSEMFWERQTGIFAEDGAMFQRQSVGFSDLLEAKPPNIYSIWEQLVEEYTGRRLTRETDKLPALSGMAKILASANHDEYVAGLWQNWIIQGLNWKVSTYEPYTRKNGGDDDDDDDNNDNNIEEDNHEIDLFSVVV
ncbi:hypothetical protein LTR84_003605 [Exophiala bonariae]|uniref:Heterokaryon incompatibility domain-containing protein n=1 Tax=Exophiala bonariae TaxID=1690606 RepID=A0AAV9NB78_9EURO|nr:hypothetical protein LTR84_003605 [Exophiala bonariae]